MKTKVLTKSVLVLAFAFMCTLIISAASPKNYVYDTKEENGKMISKVVFLQDNGLLNKEMKYEFAYNDEGKVSEKKAYRWNQREGEWEPLFLMTYEYTEESDEIQTNYGMWNKKKKDFSLNVQTMTVPLDNYNTIFS